MNGEGEGDKEVKMEDSKVMKKEVFMWEYLPRALPQRSRLMSPTIIRLPSSSDSWMDVCGGCCGSVKFKFR